MTLQDVAGRPYRVIEYHGPMRGLVWWCDELRIIERVPGAARFLRNVIMLPAVDKIMINLSVTL
jgi:hypothetical protein